MIDQTTLAQIRYFLDHIEDHHPSRSDKDTRDTACNTALDIAQHALFSAASVGGLLPTGWLASYRQLHRDIAAEADEAVATDGRA